MRFDIERQIDSETKEIWTFSTFDLIAVFIAWGRQVKPKGKRKWTVTEFWDKYSHRDYRMTPEPEIPNDIKEEALGELTKAISVKTWNEWKGK